MIKIYTNFNFNVLLKLCFSNISFFFIPFFPPLFLSSTRHFFLSFFLFFSPPHTYMFSFLSYPSFLLFFFPAIPPNSRTFRALLLCLFFFFFLALRLLVLGGVVDAELWERDPLLGKEAFGSVFLAKPTSKFLSFPSLMAVKSADQCCLVFY